MQKINESPKFEAKYLRISNKTDQMAGMSSGSLDTHKSKLIRGYAVEQEHRVVWGLPPHNPNSLELRKS